MVKKVNMKKSRVNLTTKVKNLKIEAELESAEISKSWKFKKKIKRRGKKGVNKAKRYWKHERGAKFAQNERQLVREKKAS